MSSKIHEGTAGGPCYLCHKKSARYIQQPQMDDMVYEKICDIEKCNLGSTSCICHACYKQVSRNICNPKYLPRWRTKPVKRELCGIFNCKKMVHRHTNIASPSNIELILGKKIVAFSVAESVTSPLCEAHYLCVYKFLRESLQCESCNSKCEERYSRHCPSPDIINTYLSISNEPSALTRFSIICNSCYQFFIRIGHQEKSDSKETENVSEMPDILTILSKEINLIKSKGTQISKKDYIELNVCYAAQHLHKAMTKNEAKLLPILYKSFCKSSMDKLCVFPHLQVTNSEMPCQRWFACRLHHYFGESIIFECKHCYIGTMIYHKNCDILSALSTALGQQKDVLTISEKCEIDHIITPIDENIIRTVAVHLNQKLHDQAKKFINEFRTPDKYLSMDMSTILKETDPTLLQFIRQLTCTVRDSRRKLFAEINDDEYNVKTIRHFYALCVLLFNINNSCSAPLHVMLSEAILSNGGNLELVRIMNRIGAVASLDTSNRLATQVVQIRMKGGLKESLVPMKFTISSIDNIDILQPHAVVSSLDATRSWHGTSVQCMQPLPVTSTLTPEEVVISHTQFSSLQPIASPILLQRHKRRRTLTEQFSPHTYLVPSSQPQLVAENITYECNTTTPTINDFLLSETENVTLKQLQLDVHLVMLLKHFQKSRGDTTLHLPGIPTLINCIRKQDTESEVSNVVYADILSEKADCKATLLKVIGNLHKVFICDLNQKWVIVVGDAKVFDLLQALRVEYGENLKWLIPMPGDWHILYNYQKVMMKPYADAGLINLAKASGYRAETLTSLRAATNFRRTHLFLLQCFEALYHYFLKLFYSHKTDSDEGVYEQEIELEIHNLLQIFQTVSDECDLNTFRSSVLSTISHQQLAEMHSEFLEFMNSLSLQQDTVKFWYRFLFQDCAPYISLYTAIRYRKWEMRTASLKQLVALYTAFDRPTYQQLIPQHLYDLSLLPDYIRTHFRTGGFAIRLSPSGWRGIALDECHEMCINKDSKLAVVRPSKEKMCHISNYLPFQSKCMNNLKEQLFPERQKRESKGCHVPSSRDIATEENVKKMLSSLVSHGMFAYGQDNHGLWNFFEKKVATPEQAHDLLNFRLIGQESFEQRVKYTFLKEPSTNAPVRKKRLQTFTITQVHKQKIKQAEKERKLSQRFLKRQLAWMAENDLSPRITDTLFSPISSLPKALVDKNGLPYKSTKSATTNYLIKRYKHSPLVLATLPWVPTSVILEGMFLIQITPLPTMQNMKEYANLLSIRHIKPHYNAGVLEVHVIFDNPGGLPETPKELEQNRRDEVHSAELTDHKCIDINSSTEVPTKWRALLACRTCKRSLTTYLAWEFLQIAPEYIRNQSEQEFITNMKGIVYSTNWEREVLQRPSYSTSMDEADMRIWLHCTHCAGKKILIFSPDTDVYHIGLVFAQRMSDAHIIIQLSKSLTISPKLLDMNALLQALETDPDLSGISPRLRPQALQTLYVCTGCDYISFFVGIGKCTFLSTFFQYATFIAGGSDPPGSIGQVSYDYTDFSFFSFLRLVGCAYFRSHTSAFDLSSPISLYHSVSDTTDIFDAHAKWLVLIRKAVWLRADSDAQNVPSIEALKFHWWRCIWILGMWHSSTENEFELPALTEYGWRRIDNKLEVLWDTPENMALANERIQFILHGCKCKSGCITRRCKCRKENRTCGPGCQCICCKNAVSTNTVCDEEIHDLEIDDLRIERDDNSTDESDDGLDRQDYQEDEINSLMTSIFGNDSEDEV